MNSMNTHDQIIERLQQSVDRPSIYKHFHFTMEDLQDNPDRLKEIADYLKKYTGNYEDFRIHTWVDSETFRPMIMLELILNEEWRKHMKPLSGLILKYYQQTTKKD